MSDSVLEEREHELTSGNPVGNKYSSGTPAFLILFLGLDDFGDGFAVYSVSASEA